VFGDGVEVFLLEKDALDLKCFGIMMMERRVLSTFLKERGR